MSIDRFRRMLNACPSFPVLAGQSWRGHGVPGCPSEAGTRRLRARRALHCQNAQVLLAATGGEPGPGAKLNCSVVGIFQLASGVTKLKVTLVVEH